jgi:hypothetical protein
MRFTCVPTATAKARKSAAVVTSNVATGLMSPAGATLNGEGNIAEDDRVDRATGNRTDVHRRGVRRRSQRPGADAGRGGACRGLARTVGSQVVEQHVRHDAHADGHGAVIAHESGSV